MEFNVSEMISKGIMAISITHKGDTLTFPTPGFKSASISEREHLFDHLNKFLATLPESKLDVLWELYGDIDGYGKLSTTPQVLLADVNEVVKKIYDVVEYEDVRRYVYHGDIRFPPHLKSEYTENDLRTRNYQIRTYLKEEYIDLVVLVLGLRFMFPIWGNLIEVVRKSHGNLVKEQIVVKQMEIAGAAICQWEPYKRLEKFIEYTVDQNKIGLATMFGGLAAAEVPAHMMALALVRKLSPGTLDPVQDSDNLIKIVFNFVSYTNERMDNRYGGRINERRVIRENAEEDNSSVLDVNQINQEIPHGDQVTIEVFTENLEILAKRLYEDIDMDKVNLCVKQVNSIVEIGDYIHQAALVKWVMGKIISPDGIDGLLFESFNRCLAVTQAYLWQKGFIELAVLLTADKNPVDEEGFYNVDLAKVNKANTERLNILYPYWRQETGKIQEGKRTNLAVNAINEIAVSLNGCEWRSNAPVSLNKEFEYISSDGTWIISGNIKNQLAELILNLFE